MAVLKRKQSGDYIIQGPQYGGSGGICTWQVEPAGVAYLTVHGVRDGHRVSFDDFGVLRSRGWIWTGGSGPGPSQPVDIALLDRLVAWSGEGKVSGFDFLLSRSCGGVDRVLFSSIFSKPFLDWLRSLLGGGSLSEFDGMTASEFDAIAGGGLERLDSTLHSLSAAFCGNRVVWRLAEVVGRAAWHAEAGGPCPEVWRQSFPTLAQLHARLGEEARADPVVRTATRRRRKLPIQDPPYVWWDVDGQQIAAVLPGRTLPPGARISWTVSGVKSGAPDAFTVREGVQVSEARSEPLGPAPSYTIRVVCPPASEPDEVIARVPLADAPLVLFSSEGRLLPYGNATVHSPGAYLALARLPLPVEAWPPRGVRVVDDEVYEPNGWHGWRALRIELGPGADVRPYEIESCEPAASWHADEPPAHPVYFDMPLPVWVGSWPRVWLEGRGYFAEAQLEVGRDGDAVRASRRVLKVGTDVFVSEADGRPYIDLSAAPALADLYGMVRISCRMPSLPELPPLLLQIIRVRPAEFRYVEHPMKPDVASAVLIRTVHAVHPGAETTLATPDEGRVAFSADPIRSPWVLFGLPDSSVALRVRTPVTRLMRLCRGGPSGRWSEPPLEIRLDGIKLDDMLRVELHSEPDLSDSRLPCRLVGGPELPPGVPRRSPNTFEIALSRWRDDLGRDHSGIVQARGRGRWIDIVRLFGRSSAAMTARVDGGASHGRDLVRRLEDAAVGDDGDEVSRLSARCLDLAEAADRPPTERELLRIASSRALLHLGDLDGAEAASAGLGDRLDLYEVRLMLAVLRLRRGGIPRGERARWRDSIAREVPDCPYSRLVLAEAYARHATVPGGGLGMWDSCRRQFEAGPRLDGGPHDVARVTIDRKESILLRALAEHRLGLIPGFSEGLPTRGQWAWLPRLRFAARYLLSPWVPGGQSVPSADLPAPPSFPDRDVTLVRLVLFQAVGAVRDSAGLLAELQPMRPEEFPAIDLLRLRQFRLEGKTSEARGLYLKMVSTARVGGNHSLQEILLGETYSG